MGHQSKYYIHIHGAEERFPAFFTEVAMRAAALDKDAMERRVALQQDPRDAYTLSETLAIVLGSPHEPEEEGHRHYTDELKLYSHNWDALMLVLEDCSTEYGFGFGWLVDGQQWLDGDVYSASNGHNEFYSYEKARFDIGLRETGRG